MKFSFPKRRSTQPLAHGQKRPMVFLILSVLSLLCLIILVIFYRPGTLLSLGAITFSIVPIFFFVIALFTTALVTYLTRSKRRGVLAGIFVVAFFWLRLEKLLHPLFAILLVALFLTLELLFSAKKEE